MMKKLTNILLIAVLFIGSFVITQKLSAQQLNSCIGGSHNVHGQLWSSNIGWVYLNCGDIANFASVPDFGVDQDTNGKWSGYGWSSNIGWIKFGDDTCPGTAIPASDASGCKVQKLTRVNGNHPIVGWAKFLAGDTSTVDSWDGWISMNTLNDQNPGLAGMQTAPAYGIELASTTTPGTPTTVHRKLSGFAWGSTVVGWLGFDNSTMNYVEEPAIPPASIRLTATPNPLAPSATTVDTLKYEIVLADKDKFDPATKCTGSITTPNTNAPTWVINTLPGVGGTTLSNTISNVKFPADPTTYKISCKTIAGQTVTDSVTVARVAGAITLSHNGNICVASSTAGTKTTTLSWTGTVSANSCQLSQDGTPIGGTKGLNDSYVLGPLTAAGTHTYVVTCGSYQSNIESVTVLPDTDPACKTCLPGDPNCTPPPDAQLIVHNSGPICTTSGANPTSTTLSWNIIDNPSASPYTYCTVTHNGIEGTTHYPVTGSTTVSETGDHTVTCYGVTGSTNTPLFTTDTITNNCTDPFTSNAGEYSFCPAGTPFGPHLPFTATWDADNGTAGSATSCKFGPRGFGGISPVLSTLISGSYPITNADVPPSTYLIKCTYPSGNGAVGNTGWKFTILDAASPTCSEKPPTVPTRPIIKQQ